jgi:hypothetical protein
VELRVLVVQDAVNQGFLLLTDVMNLVERKAADRDARADLRAVGRLQWPWVH